MRGMLRIFCDNVSLPGMTYIVVETVECKAKMAVTKSSSTIYKQHDLVACLKSLGKQTCFQHNYNSLVHPHANSV